MAGFDIEAARKAGYGDDEILQHLTSTRKFDVDGALKAGHSKQDIIGYLATTPAPTERTTPKDPSLNATISATPAPQGIGQRISRWADDALGDMRYGGDKTVIGRMLGKLGATPLYNGASPESAEQMGSPMLGVLRMLKGGGQVATPGKRVAGAKEVAGGALQAAQLPLSFVAPEGIGAGHGAVATKALTIPGKAAKAVLPSTARAGARFDKVAEVAGELPIKVVAPSEAAFRADELAKAGGSMPKVLRDFLKRVTDPEKGPMTYNEARDFYSNSTRLSANEGARLTPVMRRQVAEFTGYLDDAIAEAARKAGSLDDYQKAMKEWHNAMRARDAGRAITKAATGTAAKAALGTTVGALAGKVAYDRLTK